jgi:hypothetical protein
LSNPSYKTTKWSNLEVEQVKELVEEGLSYEQIGLKLNRNPKSVQTIVEDRLMMNLSEDAQNVRLAEQNIKASPEWRELCNQLDEEEQDYFLYNWRETVAQFKNDITHTEKLQLIEMIRTEILINRAMRKTAMINREMNRLQALIEDESSKPDPDTDLMAATSRSFAETMTSVSQITKELDSLSKRKDQILKDIKGTREQRIERIEHSKETLTAWIASLVANPELRRDLGLIMEKNRIAKDAQYITLTDYFKYANGELEQPFLSHLTIKEDNI